MREVIGRLTLSGVEEEYNKVKTKTDTQNAGNKEIHTFLDEYHEEKLKEN